VLLARWQTIYIAIAPYTFHALRKEEKKEADEETQASQETQEDATQEQVRHNPLVLYSRKTSIECKH